MTIRIPPIPPGGPGGVIFRLGGAWVDLRSDGHVFVRYRTDGEVFSIEPADLEDWEAVIAAAKRYRR